MDHLSTLPVEVLVQIISQLPSSKFLSLVHTSRFFEKFMRTNAKELCNATITSHPELSNLATYLNEDWADHKETSSFNFFSWYAFRNPAHKKYVSIITTPGPEYLLFLEQLAADNAKYSSGETFHHPYLTMWRIAMEMQANETMEHRPLGELVWYYRSK